MWGHEGGNGGGGAFVEALVVVKPGERLEITIGGGGEEGHYGLNLDDPEMGEDVKMGATWGVAKGGVPGGGEGYGGNHLFAAGGGE